MVGEVNTDHSGILVNVTVIGREFLHKCCYVCVLFSVFVHFLHEDHICKFIVSMKTL